MSTLATLSVVPTTILAIDSWLSESSLTALSAAFDHQLTLYITSGVLDECIDGSNVSSHARVEHWWVPMQVSSHASVDYRRANSKNASNVGATEYESTEYIIVQVCLSANMIAARSIKMLA